MTQPHLYLIDGSGFIFRAFHALPPLTRPDGTPINAVLGFSNMLVKILEHTKAEYLAVVFDAARHNFRHHLYPEYKANRSHPPEELIPQFSLIREACTAFNVTMIEKEGYEADDLIATYVKQAEKQQVRVTIISSDKDLMQLVNESVLLQDPLKNILIGRTEVIEKFGVPPEKVLEVQALAGDSSDNIPGVPGIGIKTAAELIRTYGTVENLLKNTSEITQPKRRQALLDHAEKARLSYQLVSLDTQVPLDLSFEDFKWPSPDPIFLETFLKQQNFNQLFNRLKTKGILKTDHHTSFSINQMSHPLDGSYSIHTTPYHLVIEEKILEQWIQKAKHHGKVAIDTETTSLNPLCAELVGVSLALSPGEACYIPVGHRSSENLIQPLETSIFSIKNQIPLKIVLNYLRPLLSDPSILKIGHNLKYDMLVLSQFEDIQWKSIADTMVMSYDLDNTKNKHNLDDLAQIHLNHTTLKYHEVAGVGKDQITFDRVPLEKALAYAAEDADITLRLYEVFQKRVIQEHMKTLYETIDLPVIKVLFEMEKEGIGVDVQVLNKLGQIFSNQIKNLTEEIYELAGHPFNIGSPKQLGEILFDHMKLDVSKKGKSGAYSTSSEVLENLSSQGHLLPMKVIQWRQLSKLKNTYTDALVKEINPRTHRIHTSYLITITSTGRLSSSDPNLQNIPIRTPEGRKIRNAFPAESGKLFLSLDYSQIELRLLAHMADLPSLKEAFAHDLDIHALTASEVFNIPLPQMTPEGRRRAKAINFGIIYGISGFGLARQLQVDPKEAATYIESYRQKYPGIFQYMESVKEMARSQGYVETLFGRRCYIQGITDRNPALRNFAERQAINAPLQGSSADIVKKAMINTSQVLKEKKLGGKLLLQVHDELIFEIPESESETTALLMKESMEKVVNLKVPLKVECTLGKNWGQLH